MHCTRGWGVGGVKGRGGAEGKAVSRDHRSPSLDITERRMDSQSDPSQHSLESSETSRKANTVETCRSWSRSRVELFISLRATGTPSATRFRSWTSLPRDQQRAGSSRLCNNTGARTLGRETEAVRRRQGTVFADALCKGYSDTCSE